MFYTVSSNWGVALVFGELKDLEEVVSQLQGFIGHIQDQDVKPPYLYNTADAAMDKNEVDQWLEWLKYHLAEEETDAPGVDS